MISEALHQHLVSFSFALSPHGGRVSHLIFLDWVQGFLGTPVRGEPVDLRKPRADGRGPPVDVVDAVEEEGEEDEEDADADAAADEGVEVGAATAALTGVGMIVCSGLGSGMPFG